MDEFDQKRGMIKLLMDALKKHGSDEVSGSMGKEQLTHTPVPEGSVAEHPHKKAEYSHGEAAKNKMPMDEPTLGDSMPSEDMKMSDGGMAAKTDEPEEVMADEVMAHGDREAPKEEMAEGPIEEQDEENNSSSFSAFRKKKK